MATYQKNTQVVGSWVDKSKLKTGMRAKIVTETNPEPSKWADEKTGEFKMQDVCKVKFEGLNDSFKTSLNRTTLNALVEAHGGDSKNWIDKVLTVEMKKVDGKTYLYLVPEGYRRTEDTEGYTIITKNVSPSTQPVQVAEADIPVINEESEPIDDKSLPF